LPERAFREHDNRDAAAQRIGHPIGAGHALTEVSFFDRDMFGAPNHEAYQRVAQQPLFGNESKRNGQCRHQDDCIDVAGVIDHQYSRRIVLEVLHT